MKNILGYSLGDIYNCPFCGSKRVKVCRTNDNACWIRCSDCGTDAKSGKTREEAFNNWNRRCPFITDAEIIDDQDLDYYKMSNNK